MGKVELPSGWKSVKLGEIAEYYDGTHQTPEYIESGVPFISVENIDNLKGSKKYISTADFDKYKIKPQKNDIFMTRIGELGLVNIVEDDEPLAYYVTLTLIRPKEIFPHFLLFFINSNAFQRELNKRALLNAVPPKINLGDIGKMSVLVPPLSEQQAIAEILTIADKLIAIKERLIVAKQKQKQWLMQHLLTGKIRLLGFSGEWEKTTLEKHMQIETGSQNTEDKIENGRYPFFVRSQQIENIDSYSYDCEAVLTAGDGVGTGKVFHYINGKFNAHQRVYVMSQFNGITGIYFYYFFSNNFLSVVSKYTAKTSVDSVRRDMIANMQINLPPLPEQQAITNVLTTADREIELLKKELEQHKQIKKYLMQKLLTGKIRVKGASE